MSWQLHGRTAEVACLIVGALAVCIGFFGKSSQFTDDSDTPMPNRTGRIIFIIVGVVFLVFGLLAPRIDP